MSFKILFLSFVLAIVVLSVNAAISPASMIIKQRSEEALREQMLKAKSDTSVCHTYYSEVLKNLLDAYQTDITQCEENESAQMLALSNEGDQSREATEASLNEVCASLDECKAESVNLDFFECISTLGETSTRVVWKASRDSSDIAAKIRQQINVIKFQKEKCTSDAERKYIVDTTKATDDMNACYANGGTTPSTPVNLYQHDLEDKSKLENLKSTVSKEKSKLLLENGEKPV